MCMMASLVCVFMRLAVVAVVIVSVMVVIVFVRSGSLIPDPGSGMFVGMPVRLVRRRLGEGGMLVRVHGHGLLADDAELRRANAGPDDLFGPD